MSLACTSLTVYKVCTIKSVEDMVYKRLSCAFKYVILVGGLHKYSFKRKLFGCFLQNLALLNRDRLVVLVVDGDGFASFSRKLRSYSNENLNTLAFLERVC